jgi:hypothetical protein
VANGYNHEIYKLYKEMEVTRNIRKRRLRWVGNVTIKGSQRAVTQKGQDQLEGPEGVG